jgi:hypothetical protein
MTYLSAKSAGFQGTYTDWVNAGRPEGGTGSAGSTGLTWTDHNNDVHTLDLNPNIIINEIKKTGLQGMNTSWMNQYAGLPDDIFVGRRDDNWWAKGIDYSLFDDPKQAKQALEGYLKFSSQIVGKAGTMASDIKNQYGTVNHRDAMNQFTREFQTYTGSQEFQQASTQANQAIQQTQDYQQQNPDDSRFGINPRTGQPLTETQAFSLARQATPGISFSDFQANTQQYLETAGINLRNADMTRPGEGTIQEQNKTGMPYPTWAEQQRAQGQPSSYQDWLSADRGTPANTASAPNAPTADTAQSDSMRGALDVLESSPFFQNLPEDQKALLRMTVKSWDPAKEVNMENVLKEFERIKTQTIDPQFKEQIDVFSSDVRDQWANIQANRGMELEGERAMAGGNIRQARSDLEGRGMTFSGQGIEQLGAKSAFAQEGEGPLVQRPVGANEDLTNKGGMTFQDGRFFEGNVNQANRLMSTASAQRYQENLRRLGRQAETQLGAAGAASLLPGFVPAGQTTGSIEAGKQQQLGTTLTQLSGQQRLNTAQSQPLDYQFNA